MIEPTIERVQESNIQSYLVERERNIVNEFMKVGMWPDDEPSRRVWALSFMAQIGPKLRSGEANTDEMAEMIVNAERIIAYVNSGTDPQASTAQPQEDQP